MARIVILIPVTEIEILPSHRFLSILFKLCFQVVKLDITNQKATLDNGWEIKYDKCLIATGGKPKNIPVFAKATEEVQKRTTLFRNVSVFV